MKKTIFNATRFRAIEQVLRNYPQVFDGKPQASLAVDQFQTDLAELRGILSSLTVPLKAVYYSRVAARKALLAEFRQILDLAMIVAVGTNNRELHITLTAFSRRYRSVSTSNLLVMAEQLENELTPNIEQAEAYGLTADRLDEFKQKVHEYQQQADNVNHRLGNRTAVRMRIRELNGRLSGQLVDFFDKFVRSAATQYPEFSFAYRRVRFSRHRRPSSRRLPENSDISGMVTDARTLQPIPGATLMLLQHNEVETTGNDGYFLFSDLQPGAYTISCHAIGYNVPDPVNLDLGANDSIIHNFSLTPTTPQP